MTQLYGSPYWPKKCVRAAQVKPEPPVTAVPTKHCEHRNRTISKLVTFSRHYTHLVFEDMRNVPMNYCHDCDTWLSLGPANDSGKNVRETRNIATEIRAARIAAGYESANDTDDTLGDHVCRNVILHYVDEANLTPAGERVHYLAEIIKETP